MYIKIKSVIILLFITFIFISCQSETKTFKRTPPITQIGQHFKLNNIVDTSGSKVELDFSQSELTIIDIWNNNCPPCIEEMKQFLNLM